jgi:hypothetical protein
MKVMKGLAFVQVAGLFVLTALAQASPPDPTWIAGIYDDGDFDDVVVSLANGSALEPEPVGHFMPAPVAGHIVEPGEDPVHPTTALPSFSGRAPPACASSRPPAAPTSSPHRPPSAARGRPGAALESRPYSRRKYTGPQHSSVGVPSPERTWSQRVRSPTA